MASECHPVTMSFWQEWEIIVLYKTVILELMQSICAVDGKLISKACNTIQMFPPKC